MTVRWSSLCCVCRSSKVALSNCFKQTPTHTQQPRCCRTLVDRWADRYTFAACLALPLAPHVYQASCPVVEARDAVLWIMISKHIRVFVHRIADYRVVTRRQSYCPIGCHRDNQYTDSQMAKRSSTVLRSTMFERTQQAVSEEIALGSCTCTDRNSRI